MSHITCDWSRLNNDISCVEFLCVMQKNLHKYRVWKIIFVSNSKSKRQRLNYNKQTYSKIKMQERAGYHHSRIAQVLCKSFLNYLHLHNWRNDLWIALKSKISLIKSWVYKYSSISEKALRWFENKLFN